MNTGRKLTYMLEDNDLPGYTRTSESREQFIASPVRIDSSTREHSEHAVSLFSSNGRPWVTLTLVSNAPTGGKIPVYFTGDMVRGSAELVLDGPHKIHSVFAEVRSIQVILYSILLD